jgi:hypothetical protein
MHRSAFCNPEVARAEPWKQVCDNMDRTKCHVGRAGLGMAESLFLQRDYLYMYIHMQSHLIASGENPFKFIFLSAGPNWVNR